MGRITAVNHVSLDGVMQAPGRADEDPRGGFQYAWMLLIHPRVLGSGQRLFAADGPPITLRLTDSVTTTTGVVIATYAAADG
jgi:hypothetical protein